MVIVITLPTFIDGEAERIVGLLRRPGIDRLHLRKPQAALADVEALLCQIPQSYYSRITLHDHFELAQRYGLSGIHLTGRSPRVPASWRGMVSTSCHSLEELSRRQREGYLQGDGQQRHFAYLSLSPIFDSISKVGYHAAFTPSVLADAARQGIIDDRVLALGGVTFESLPRVYTMGFGGAMILGDAWR